MIEIFIFCSLIFCSYSFSVLKAVNRLACVLSTHTANTSLWSGGKAARCLESRMTSCSDDFVMNDDRCTHNHIMFYGADVVNKLTPLPFLENVF